MIYESRPNVTADAFALCFSTEEQKEGMEAFLSKRKPNFKGV
jgi:enoyl-CoA hydratase